MSGYVDCACRDCFDVAISSDGEPSLCSECEEHGCDAEGESECESPSAYGMSDEKERCHERKQMGFTDF